MTPGVLNGAHDSAQVELALLLRPTISTYAYSIVTRPANNSTPVHSAQARVHRRLESVVRSHLTCPWLHQPHAPSQQAFQALATLLADEPYQPLILDSGCGTGQSTRDIAALYPESRVIGIDQSAHRLARAGAKSFPYCEGNIVLLRAELSSFWYLAQQAGWTLQRHYLLYPNPWPKAAQLRRRWHGHPVFPAMLALGGVLEMRCNWEVYAHEFAKAVRQVRDVPCVAEELQPDRISSAFEVKYRNSGLPLFRVSVCLDS